MRAGGSRRDTEFASFVAARRSSMVRTARLLTAGDEHRAEDLVQTALTNLYIAAPHRPGWPDGYVQRVLVNCFIDLTRKPWWRREQSHDVLPESGRASHVDDAVDDHGSAVLRALAQLPDGQRAAVLLRHWLDLDVMHCAALLGVHPGTVKSQTARGLAFVVEVNSHGCMDRRDDLRHGARSTDF